jgi:hypothetical protein
MQKNLKAKGYKLDLTTKKLHKVEFSKAHRYSQDICRDDLGPDDFMPVIYTEEKRKRFVKAGLALINRTYDEVIKKYGTSEEKKFWFGNESEV